VVGRSIFLLDVLRNQRYDMAGIGKDIEDGYSNTRRIP
jgi:hypothetical protein